MGAVGDLIQPVVGGETLASFSVTSNILLIVAIGWFVGLIGLQSFYLAGLRRSVECVDRGN